MSMGQGATVSLPILAIYMKNVNGNPDFGYDPNAKFDLPENYNPCLKEDGAGTDDFTVDDIFE